MEPSFEKLLVTLAKAEVRFIVVEGLAVSLNGYVRLTEDVDFVVDTGKDNISRLIEKDLIDVSAMKQLLEDPGAFGGASER